ncbi:MULTISPECIES: twin-arginine translocation signal domain-containing protein [unclassified Haladaptatus]|uniref:twin-arginine translocation signal domain-containing protein n=1 Tax=unclassified Haladaptatus TaxID=2622732 RepID=UPI00209BBEAF|nr:MULTISPECIES: twin-arginine translocation signal domain-containing protein [unclassified Haladaptatus]MCO8244179.1 twin-arginine translocation signal domain-containing protein [Haladaptatus sp. AB643]MCO8255984.1 twin-arginine translocation signal domain-containing protein [Haladaptatus sp. AB618]
MTGNDAGESKNRRSRRTFLGAVAAAGLVGTSGCVTLDPKARVSGTDESKIFEKVSVSEPWASGRVSASVSLTPAATTEYGVRELTVISSSGSEFDTGTVQSGQTSKTVFVPVGKSTLSAVDYDGKTVDSVTVTVGGNKIL